eukprot:gene16567-18247_t
MDMMLLYKAMLVWISHFIIQEFSSNNVYNAVHTRAVHSAYVIGEGCLDMTVCHKTVCHLQMDGTVHERVENIFKAGMFFSTFTYPGFVHNENKYFNTYDGDPSLLVRWLNAITENTVILGCIRDDGTKAMDQAAWQALESIGLAKPYSTVYRTSMALIGFKGSWPHGITRSKTDVSKQISVRLNYVMPPRHVTLSLSNSNELTVSWHGDRCKSNDVIVLYSATTRTSLTHYNKTVKCDKRYTVLSSLLADNLYNVSVQMSESRENHTAIQSNPLWLIVGNNAIGCSRGYYQFVLKVDGRKDTFDFDSNLWEDNNKILNDQSQHNGFDSTECKTRNFVHKRALRICAVMRDLSSNRLTFSEFSVPSEKTMDDWQNGPSSLTGSLAAWNRLIPDGMPSLHQMCKQGFKRHYQDQRSSAKFRFGFAADVTQDCNFYEVVGGYGLQEGSTRVSAGFIDTSGNTAVIKETFGYILIPYYRDAFWGGWNKWAVCNRACGTGTTFRYRLSHSGFGGGRTLPAKDNRTTTCKIQDCIPPAPENIKATMVSSTSMKVEWDDIPRSSLTNEKLHYKILTNGPNGQNWNMTATFHVYYFNSLKPYTLYCFQVLLVLQSKVEGNISDSTCERTDESVPLDPPANIAGSNVTAWCLLITWSPIPTERAQGIITKYLINYWKQSGGSAGTLTRTTTSNSSLEICELEPYTAYSFKICGFTRIGKGPMSIPVTGVYTDEYIPSVAPSIASTEHTSSTSMKIKWQNLAAPYWRGVPYMYVLYYVLKDIYTVTGAASNVSSAFTNYPATEIELTQLEKYKFYVIWMCAFTIKGSGIANSTTKEQRTDQDVPSRGPDARAHNSSSFSIIANWTELEYEYRLGILLEYRVFCTNLKTNVEVTVGVDAAKLSAEIKDLLPFKNHSVEVAGVTSKGVGTRGTAVYTLTDEYKPSAAPPNFFGVNISSYALRLNWSLIPSDHRLGIIRGYTIMYKNTSSEDDHWNTTVVHSGHLRHAEIHNLTAYTFYSLKIAGFTKMGDGTFSDEIVVRTDEDAPYEPPRSLKASEINAFNAIINWSPPHSSAVRGIIRGYKIMYTAVYSPLDFTSHLLITSNNRRRRSLISKPLDLNQYNVTVSSSQFHLDIRDLQGATNYSVEILAFTIREGVVSAPLYIYTKENIPAMAPINVTAHNATYTSLMVRWKHIFPAYAHGNIEGFLVYYQLGNHSEATAHKESQIARRTFLEVTHLHIFALYTIQVAAYTKVGIGIKSKPVYAKTDEWVPSKAPDSIVVNSYLKSREFDVSWSHLDYKYWNGIPLGYQIVATTISIGGVKVKKSERLTHTLRVDSHFNNVKFSNMQSYCMYGIQVSAYTRKGVGPSSAMKYLETCYLTKGIMSTSWIDHMPMIKQNPHGKTAGGQQIMGFLPPLLLKILKQCSGLCAEINIRNNGTLDFQRDGHGRPARKSNLQELLATMSSKTDLMFPVLKPSYSIEDYKYIEIMSMSKVVLVEGKPLVNTIGLAVSNSLSPMLYMLLVFVLFCLLAGCCMWLLERYADSDEVRRHPVYGIFDGFYWAFVVATTVGYGDIVPSRNLSRIFSMIWSLIGLILVVFLTGTLTSVLTSSESSVKIKTVPKSGIGMVKDSWEFLVAQKKGMKIDKNYSDYMELLNAVGNGTVKNGLLDVDVATIWSEKLAKESISIKALVNLGGSMGIFATGDARKLAGCFRAGIKEESGFILNEKIRAIQIETAHISKQLQVNTSASTAVITVADTGPKFYSWESTVMQFYIKGGAMILGVFLVLGSIYEIIRCIRKRRGKNNSVKPRFEKERLAGIMLSHFGHAQSSTQYRVNEEVNAGPSDEEPAEHRDEPAQYENIYPSLTNLDDNASLDPYAQLMESLSSTIPVPSASVVPNATVNDIVEAETSVLIEKLASNFVEIMDELENLHVQERLKLQRLKWDLYGMYKYVDPTDYGVPFDFE